MTPPKIATGERGRLIAALIVLALVQAVAAALAAFATRWLFIAMDQAGPLPVLALAGLAGTGLVIAGVRVVFRRLGEGLGQDYATDIRLALFDHASRMSHDAMAARRVGYMTLRFVGDLSALKDWLARGLPMLVEGAVMAPAMVAILFVLDPAFGVIGAVVAVLSLAGLVVGAAGLMQAHRRVRARRALLAAELSERIPIAPELASFGRRTLELKAIKRRSRQVKSASQLRVTQGEAMRVLPDALSALAAAALIWWGAGQGLGTGTIAAGLAVLALTARPMRDLMGVTDRAGAFRAAHAKLTAALARPMAEGHEPGSTVRETRLATGRVAIELAGAVVGDGPPLSLVLARGGRMTLPPGVDAERLFWVICGLQPLEAGEIKLNDIPVQTLSPGSLRRVVYRIDAHPVVLKGSLRRALTLGLADRPDDPALRTRLEAAGLRGVLDRLGGLDSRLTEGARTLSGESRIAISVLRAALGRPGLLLVSGAPLLCPDAAEWLRAHRATVLLANAEALTTTA